jgi:hypothetical protein
MNPGAWLVLSFYGVVPSFFFRNLESVGGSGPGNI